MHLSLAGWWEGGSECEGERGAWGRESEGVGEGRGRSEGRGFDRDLPLYALGFLAYLRKSHHASPASDSAAQNNKHNISTDINQ